MFEMRGSVGVMVKNSSLRIDSGEKFYLDAGGDTYWHELVADQARLVIGGQIGLNIIESGTEVNIVFAIPTAPTNKETAAIAPKNIVNV